MIKTRGLRGWRIQLRPVGVCVALVLACGAQGAWAGGGVVALQTAAPSCPDDSGNIYVDCGNGTVTDNRTGLVWLANASCLNDQVDWYTAMEFAAGLSDLSGADPNDCGLSDGSSPGEWRLPSVKEWEAMVPDAVALGCVSPGFGGPSITNDQGSACWQEGSGNSFSGLVSSFYWSPTTSVSFPTFARAMFLHDGRVGVISKAGDFRVWPVRGGQ